MVVYQQTKFGCKNIISSEDIVETVILWLYKPLWWPWPWRQYLNSFAWHSGSGLCTTIPALDTKSWAVQKISEQGRTFGVKSFKEKTCLDFVIPSLHDTILSPSCMVRCPGVTERALFFCIYIYISFWSFNFFNKIAFCTDSIYSSPKLYWSKQSLGDMV